MPLLYAGDAKKGVGSSCIGSSILLAVVGALLLVFALTRQVDPSEQGDGQASRGEDLAAYSKPARVVASTIRRASATPESARPAGFFFDIGTVSSRVSGHTRSQLLEQKGWAGICAVPFPRDFGDRKCKVVASPVGGTTGQKVQALDCSHSPCASAEASTIGIADLLSMSEAPPIVDYVALDTQGSEVDILDNFPFDDFCVRSWTVKHSYDDARMTRIRQTLEVAHGCRVREGAGDEYWARCICDKQTSKLMRAETPAAKAQAAPPTREVGGVKVEAAVPRSFQETSGE